MTAPAAAPAPWWHPNLGKCQGISYAWFSCTTNPRCATNIATSLATTNAATNCNRGGHGGATTIATTNSDYGLQPRIVTTIATTNCNHDFSHVVAIRGCGRGRNLWSQPVVQIRGCNCGCNRCCASVFAVVALALPFSKTRTKSLTQNSISQNQCFTFISKIV